ENARQAVVAERVRIARDLHDVVAHHVAVIGVQAGAARRLLATDHDQASRSLETIERTARTAVSELRGLLGVLRADGDRLPDEDVTTSSPGLAQLPDLVAEAESTGLTVRYAVYGTERPVPESVALSAYRVAQEALTNVVKHANATAADLRVRYLDSALEIEITDDGRSRPVPGFDTATGGGLGLTGMRERVAVHGGQLEVGPRRDGGFR